jgi:hypothetical protein
MDDMGPSARSSLAVAYDRNRDRLVLFGGLTANGPSGETWEWDGQYWTQLSETGPQARILHCASPQSKTHQEQCILKSSLISGPNFSVALNGPDGRDFFVTG